MNAARLAPPAVAAAAPVSEWWRADVAAPARPARTRSVTFVAIWLYTVILIAAPQEFVPALGPLRLALVVGAIAIAFHVADRWTGRVPGGWSFDVRVVLALLAWAIVSVPFSYWPSGSIGVITGLFLKSLAAFLVVSATVDSVRRFRWIALTLVGCGVLIAVTAVDHYRAGILLPDSSDRIAGYGTSALAGNPNDLALLLNIILPFGVALAAERRNRSWRLLLMGAVAVMVAGVVVTLSRAGFLALTVTAALLAWRAVRRGGFVTMAMVAVVILVGIVVVPSVAGARLGTLTTLAGDGTGSAIARWRDIGAAASFVVRHPLIGAGAGMDYLALNQIRGDAWISVHNVYLNYAVDLGLVGLALFLALFWHAYRGVARTERRCAQQDPRAPLALFAMAARVALVSFAVAGFFHPVAYHVYFYYLAGLAIAARHISDREEWSS